MVKVTNGRVANTSPIGQGSKIFSDRHDVVRGESEFAVAEDAGVGWVDSADTVNKHGEAI
jgi:hypothetical protein